MRRRIVEVFGVLLIIVVALTVSFSLANYVTSNDTARNLVEHFGYLGVLLVAIIIGLNLFLPVPAGTLVPIYVVAGLWLPAIIVIHIMGAFIADTISYFVGVGGKHLTQKNPPKFQKKMMAFEQEHHKLILPSVFLYAAFSPFPNEIILIPLALVGIRFRVLWLPLLVGTAFYETLVAYGVISTFRFFF